MKLKQKLYLVLFCLLGIINPIAAQSSPITGNVSDQSGAMPGITITIKGTTQATVTDIDGNFSIEASSSQTLVFNCIGYNTQEILVGSQKHIKVVLAESQTDLDEIVVIGYGTAKKSELTGAISSVRGEDLRTTPSSSVNEMLRGKAPGLQVTLNSGRPGSESEVLIRGSRSLLTGGNSPLYVVDGITTNSIADINPQDILSIEILKDAASQSIYGARAANGVIFLTTKRGQSGKPIVEYSGYYGTQHLSRNFDFYNGEEWYQLRKEAKRTDGQAVDTAHDVLDDAILEENYANKNFTDWEDLMIKPALLTKHDVSVRGGSDKVKVASSLGYYYQKGMVAPSDYNRLTFRLNVDWDVTKILTLGTNLSYSYAKQNREDGQFSEFITRTPLGKPFNEDGTPTKDIANNTVNPLFKTQEYSNLVTTERTNIALYLLLKPFKDFSYKLNASMRGLNREDGEYKTDKYPGSNSEGILSYAYDRNYVVENIFNYDWALNKLHKFNFTAVQSFDIEDNRGIGFSGKNGINNNFEWNGIPDAGIYSDLTRGYIERQLASFVGRVRYNLMEKYLFNLSIRRDGASVFSEDNKWGTFGAASFAWRVSEESFLKNIEQISSMKLRLNYGSVGNQGISTYRTLGLVGDYPIRFGDELFIGYSPTGELHNPYLKWETTTSANAGLDLSLFDNRINLTADYYKTRTTDLLVRKGLIEALGYSFMYSNLGETKTNGIDLQLSADIIRQKDLNWSVTTTFSKSKSEIIKIDGKVDENGKPMDDLKNQWFIGDNINIVSYNYEFDGIWQTGDDFKLMPDAKPGDIKVKDIDGDGAITTNDRRTYTAEPDWYGSFSTNLSYKGIDFYAELYTIQGLYKENAFMWDPNSGGSLQGKLNGMKVNYWTPENPSNEAPRASHNTNALYHSTLGIQDASYFRLRTITLGYTLPQAITQKVQMEKVRVYATATNLYTDTKFKSYSPELKPNQYPEPKQIIFGLNVTF